MLNSILHLLFPKVCASCALFLQDNEQTICTVCRHEMPLTNHHLLQENAAFQSFYGRVDVVFAAAFVEFHKKGMVQELIHKLKYKNRQDVGSLLGFWCAESWTNIPQIYQFDYIIAVPLHKKRQRQRGYNQVHSFATALSSTWQIPVLKDVLLRKEHTKTQVRKSRLQRSQDLIDAFELSNHNQLEGKHFLLLDDVITTGATLEFCCKELQKITGCKLSIICIAITV